MELSALRDLQLNYSPDVEPTREDGWTVDSYVQVLPKGSFDIARRLVQDYEFADPGIIKAVWLPDTPLEQRDMLLEGRFLWMRFFFGVRVNKVIDTVDDRNREWGWCYATLHGHFEAGEMCYRVVEDRTTGEVRFAVNRFVRTGEIPSWWIRLGWHTFGRYMQVRFVKRSLARMKLLVETELTGGPPVPRAAEQIDVAQVTERPHPDQL